MTDETETKKDILATPEIENKVTHIDEKRVEKLAQSGNYWGILDSWHTLEVKIAYGEKIDPFEVRNYILLTKYLMKYGHSESLQIKCRKVFERYMDEQGL